MKFILLNGPSSVGKSHIINAVMAGRERLFHLSYDKLKWQFSRYHGHHHYRDVEHVVLATADAVFAMNYDVISDTALHKDFRILLLALAKKHGREIIEINLEAEYPVLLARFEVRIAEARTDPERKISNLSKERFKELFDMYHHDKNAMATTFRTDIETSEAISEKILKLFLRK